ncbi:MAG: imidazolonepropionase [Kofleriaceae bacterium]|nr:imidazolonepropionase [Kofleriaceae bacterium]
MRETRNGAEEFLLHNSSMVMTCSGEGLGLITDGAVHIKHGQVAWVGRSGDIDRSVTANARKIDLGGGLLTPGLIDSHAHPLFAGNRANEFEMRSEGADYLEIAKAGGGINATVGPTRDASFDELLANTLARLKIALRGGTTTMEAKSGYDLRASGEIRLLQVAQAASLAQPIDLMPTLLGAHVLPPEYKDRRDAYVDLVVEKMIPQTATENLADAVDVYCDEGAFTLAETERILRCAKEHGLKVKAHVGQFVDLGGPELIADLGGLSCDHLEQISEAGMQAMARAGVVATMLPGACVQLKMPPPPVAQLRKHGVALALASDLNPGSSNCETLSLPMWLATTHFGMTVAEAWLGVTRHAACALGRNDIGQVSPGHRADLVLWDAEYPGEIPYRFGTTLVNRVWKDGVLCSDLVKHL